MLIITLFNNKQRRIIYILNTYNLIEYLIFNKYQEKFKNALEVSLKQLAQKKFEKTQNRKDFIKHFNKSYL